MVQYQTFPDASGHSRTLDKLKALRLPSLEGRSFLDVGCNEGFFCGFAQFMGASRSVGIDHSYDFVHRARQRFPDCEFRAQDWSRLPKGQFDVVLLASALHYADDQPALIARLVDKLTPEGVLIIEMGIVSSPEAEWVKVKRGIDERYFPTMPQLKRVLSDYAWKWMGASVKQDGDPVARHVIHVSRRRPVAYLLMQPPAYGKSSLAHRLFPPAGIPIVSGDQTIQRIAQGELEAHGRLATIVRETYTPFTIDKAIDRIFESDAGDNLVSAWIAQSGGGDFAVDGYVPTQHQGAVELGLSKAGYMPVVLRWERVGPTLLPLDSLSQQAEAFQRSLEVDDAAPDGGSRKPVLGRGSGYVDDLRIEAGRILLRGWAVDEDGEAPTELMVHLRGEDQVVAIGEVWERRDVQRHLKAPHGKFGYQVSLPALGIKGHADLADAEFHVTLTSGRPLRLAKSVLAAMANAGESM